MKGETTETNILQIINILYHKKATEWLDNRQWGILWTFIKKAYWTER